MSIKMEKKKLGRPRKVKTIEEIEVFREKQRLYSAEYYRKNRDQILEKARKGHAGQRRGPVEEEEGEGEVEETRESPF